MINFNPHKYEYPSQRKMVYGKKGMVATSHPLAAQAGLEIMQKGGNAIDAAIATAACLTVVEPTSNGIGGDAFALVWVKGKLHGLNASGPAPTDISLETLKEKGYKEIPRYGWVPVTVPGAPAAWGELSRRFGKLPLIQVMAPAIRYAEEGHPIAPTTARLWDYALRDLSNNAKGEAFQHFYETFCIEGRAPRAGEVWASRDMAKTLRIIGESNGAGFYQGDLADKIHKFSHQYGGFLTKKDLEGYRAEWVEPVKVNYKGYDVWELPPNGHGIVALMALNIIKGLNLQGKDKEEILHQQIEAMKLAFADGLKYITDPRKMKVKVEDLLSDGYGEERRRLIGKEALQPMTGEPQKGGTVYLAAADEEGNMISFIQSNYMGFGSGLVVPGTGISLHNRGKNFSMEKEHVNSLEPGKKPYHTIIPGFLTQDDEAIGPFGVMGGFMQPQGHLQVIMNTIDFQMNPQEALDAPRWQWIKDKEIELEKQYPHAIEKALLQRGHHISIQEDETTFGRGQIIWKSKEGVLCGGTEPRTDGSIAVW
ncbi:gamma-glutamyltranspeptidase / glutathione hydrolase [Natronincola peptidivorans]|uniref:Gamma-glutamyltranspeptidase / glutathione hydrolase n=1 Tax=Natronincola peptidivorans TaxID=426128 RepID=A0A1I0A312_9FIRM|nr:gamma-glutamyltransferase family protein [Natronincola peptidivorans]SES88043.1 gamma-glutamyltranspeptidase / glutathione hydrolase [Natronincola peptidivorans]